MHVPIGRFRRAGRAENFALPRLQNAFQHFAALAGFGIGHAHAGDVEDPLGIEVGEYFAQFQGRLRNKAQAAPFEIRAQFHGLTDDFERFAIAFPRHHALVLIFDFATPSAELLQQHQDRFQDVERFESRDYHGPLECVGDELIGAAADHGGDVTGAKEPIEPQVGRIQNGVDGGDDRDVVAEDGKIGDVFFRGFQ